MKRFIILIGNYGSGKTEIAMNFALNASKTGKTLLIDLDMINTYFRLSDRRDLFEGTGVEMIAPHFANSGVEMLTVPAEIAKAFDMDWDTVIIDLGGDAGASALGQYHNKLELARQSGAEVNLYNVVNTNRPMAGTPQKLVRLMRDMQRKARWEVTGFIHNTNMSYETTVQDLESGYAVVKAASEETGVPVLYTAGKREVLDAFLAGKHDPQFVGEPFYLETYMHRDWDTLTKKGV